MSVNLIRRLLTAAVGIPAAVTIVYMDGWVLAAFVALLGVVGTAEVYGISGLAGVRPVRAMGYVAAGAFPFWVHAALAGLVTAPPLWIGVVVAVWCVAVTGGTMLRRTPGEHPLESAAVTVFGAAYAGGLLPFLIVLRHATAAPTGAAATAVVFLPIAAVWACDTAAMAAGCAIGGPKLAPVLSPKKTWAGAIAGTVTAAVVAPLYGLFALQPLGVSVGIPFLLGFGLVMAVVGQSGDIAESLFKRQVGVKDSGTFFPGHGGVLDRLDALYWALPVAAAALAIAGIL